MRARSRLARCLFVASLLLACQSPPPRAPVLPPEHQLTTEAVRQRVVPERPASPPAPLSVESEPAAVHGRASVLPHPGPARVRFESPRPWEILEIDEVTFALHPGEWIELTAGAHRVTGIAGRHVARSEFAIGPGEEATVRLPWQLRGPDPEAFAWFPGGIATVGALRYVDMNPVRETRLAGFWIARLETTVEEYRRCVESDVCEAPPADPECNYAILERALHPVNCVSARDAERFARWLSRREGLHYRLPTAQEWEALAGAQGSPGLERCNTCDASCDRLWRSRDRNDGWRTTAPAGELTGCRGAGGVYDLVGNVSELCVDPELGYVDRGGSFSQMDAFLDPAFPSPRSFDGRSSSIGFRLVVDPWDAPYAAQNSGGER